MSQTVKVLAALVFVGVMGWVLLQPVFDAVDIDDTAEQAAPSPAPASVSPPTVTPSPGPTESDEEGEPLPEGFRSEPLSASFPGACLEAATDGPDLVAVDRGDRIAIGPLRGPMEEFPAKSLAGVSVGGRVAWKQEAGMFMGDPTAEAVTPLQFAREVVWSPISHCGLAMAEDGSSLVVLPSELALIHADVRDAAFSADGRKLAVVVDGPRATSVWIASLSGRRLREVVRDKPGVAIDLEGWSPEGNAVFYRADNSGLDFVTTSVPPLSGRVSQEPPDKLDQPLEQCGGRLLGLIQNRIAEITIRGPELLTEGGSGYRYISCSPAGNFIAAIGDEGLVLLDGNGNFLRDLTQDAGYTDVYVDWGAAGRGLLFGRVRSDGSPVAAELWYISEGGSPVPTGVSYRGGPHAVDWSGSPPIGLP